MILTSQNKINSQTRGRPRKQQTRTLSPIFKQRFSDNSAIIHTSFLIYVFQVFVDTKNQKRVGHKDGGFTIYDKINSQYCFDNIQVQLKNWGCQALLNNVNMRDFVKLLPALGPKIILKEICQLINFIVECEAQGQTQQHILNDLTHAQNQQKLNEIYPYMRFVPFALHELKLDKNQKWDRSNSLLDFIRQRVNYLWQYLLIIILHTVFNCIHGKVYNKYFKPFFSDAENPGQTHIGQLNLDQVVLSVKRQEHLQKQTKGNINQEQIVDKPRKMKSFVDADGTRAIVQIIKAPQLQNKNGENIRLVMESPNKLTKMQSQPNYFNKGFSSLIKSNNQFQLQRKQQSNQGLSNFQSSWKSPQKQRNQNSNLFTSNKKPSVFQIKPISTEKQDRQGLNIINGSFSKTFANVVISSEAKQQIQQKQKQQIKNSELTQNLDNSLKKQQ